MNYAGIITDDTGNGLGIRVSLFVSGCRNNCPGCFNKEQQDFNYGKEFTDKIIDDIIKECSEFYYSGLTLLGGDPMEPENATGLLPLIKRFKEEVVNSDRHSGIGVPLAKRNIWTYTGYTYEDLIALSDDDARKILLINTDILVDGPFILEKKDISLKFRGSSNQRVIDVQESIKKGRMILYKL